VWLSAVDPIASSGESIFPDTPLFFDTPAPQRRQNPYGHHHGMDAGDVGTLRKRLADHYLSGRGLEFGALHFSLPLPMWASVRYADVLSPDELSVAFPDIRNIQLPDIVTDLETMTGIEDASEDFIVANHVLEHVEDPLKAIASISRVLRPSGIAFIALPDKRFTFDSDRTITPLEHIVKDHKEGPAWSRTEHYDEWVRCVDGLSGDAHRQKASLMLSQHANIHFHVWDYPAMMEMFAHVARIPQLGLEIETSVLNGIEVIWILRKANGRLSPA
jgi:SAM-dependent methyltransferase